MPASMSLALPTPSPSAKAASFTSWQAMRPSTSPGASPTHSTCLPSTEKKCSARAMTVGEESAPRVSSTSEVSEKGGRAWNPTELPPGSSAASEPRESNTSRGPPDSGGTSVELSHSTIRAGSSSGLRSCSE